MGSWEYSCIGYSCINNENNVEKLLSSMGIDFNGQLYNSQVGVINNLFYTTKKGNNHSSFEPVEIYIIVNKIFENTTILYEYEHVNSVCDLYERYEEIYDPKLEKMFIGEVDYCYDGYLVSGRSAFKLIKEECEEAAKKQSIPVEWDGCLSDDYFSPKGDAFYCLCRKILEDHGGLEGLGIRERREREEKIPSVKIDNKKLINVVDELAKRGFNNLVIMVKKAFSLEYDSPYMTDSQD